MTDARTDTRLRLYVGLVFSIGLGSLVWALVTAEIPTTDRWWTNPLALTVILAAANGPFVQIRFRDQQRYFTSTSAAILVAIATMPPQQVVLCTAVGVTVAKLATVRDPLKVIFNVSKDVQAAAAAAALGAAVSNDSRIGNSLHWDKLLVGLVAAALVYTLVDDILGHTVLALATHSSFTQIASRNWDVAVVARLANFALAVATVLIIAPNPSLLIAMPPTAWVFHLVAVNKLRRRAEHEAWERLATTTDELNVTDLDRVLQVAATGAPALFAAAEAEIELAAGRLVRAAGGRITYDGPPAGAPAAADPATERALEGHDGGAVGVLRLRFGRAVKFNEAEEYKFQTFASALSTAIRNATAYAELERNADANAFAATHDPLTGLVNRRALLTSIDEALTARDPDGITALLLIDLNHFKEVNDTLGHATGDKVLQHVARRLAGAAAPHELVARLGGDEFAVLLTRLAAPAVASHRADALLASLDPIVAVDGMRLTVEASGGIALAPGTGGHDELLRRADVAMYQAKRAGDRTSVYVHAHDTADLDRLVLGGELSRAVADRDLAVDIQPVVDLNTGVAIAAEAVTRWPQAERAVDARRLLRTIERSGQLPAYAAIVLDQALTAARTWQADGFDLPVAVNVAPRSLLDPDYADRVLDRITAHDLPADRLTLELTETLAISQLDTVGRTLRRLREAGVRLVLDDFGTGAGSLTLLSRLPVHELKIDPEFVRTVDSTAEVTAVVRSTVDLARSLHLDVIAEGVESGPQRQALWELGCTAGQGRLFARPMPADRLLAALLRGHDGRPGAFAPTLHDAGAVIRLPHGRRRRGPLPHLPA